MNELTQTDQRPNRKTAQVHQEIEFFRALIWCPLADRTIAEEVFRGSRSSWFTNRHTERFWRACVAILDAGEFPTHETLMPVAFRDDHVFRILLECLKPSGEFGGGCKMGLVASAQNLQEWAAAREMSEVLGQAKESAERGDGVDVELLAQEITERLSSPRDAGRVTANDLMQTSVRGYLRSLDGGPEGQSIGLAELDKVWGRLTPGSLTVVGADPGTGKSTLALAAMVGCAAAGVPAGMVSLEDSLDVIGDRLVARIIDVVPNRLRQGTALPADSLRCFETQLAEDWSRKFFVQVSGDNGRGDVVQLMTKLVRRDRCEILFVDYLQAMTYPEDSDYIGIKNNLAAVKNAAKRLEVPVVLMSQLNRESRDKEPSNRNLRGAGDIEEKAENILLLWMDDGERLAKISKAKQGPRGQKFRMLWNHTAATMTGLAPIE